MDSISDILSNKDFEIPDEVSAIKAYVAKEYDKDIAVAINGSDIIVSSRSAGLISNLRLNSPKLSQAAKTNKRIRFKIG